MYILWTNVSAVLMKKIKVLSTYRFTTVSRLSSRTNLAMRTRSTQCTTGTRATRSSTLSLGTKEWKGTDSVLLLTYTYWNISSMITK